jgi:hypothetical protein
MLMLFGTILLACATMAMAQDTTTAPAPPPATAPADAPLPVPATDATPVPAPQVSPAPAQEPDKQQPAPASSPAAVPTDPAATVPAADATAVPAQQVNSAPAQEPDKQQPAPAPATQTHAAATPSKKGARAPAAPKEKKAKPVYSGPTEVIVLPPEPLLDEEGKQRVDPDGNPLFLPAVRQQRDKKGHPLFDANGKPVFQTATDKGYDGKGKKIVVKKVKAVKMVPLTVSRGTFTVDGMIGKAELNYNIPNLKYIYLYAPGLGVAVVSNAPFPGSTLVKNAFNNNTLTVALADHTQENVADHILQLSSDKPLMGKNGHPSPAYIAVDTDFRLPSKFPVVGFGEIRDAPYVWPGAKRNVHLAGTYDPPPTPKNLLPVELLPACPKGEMRRPAPAALPGQEVPDQPCVPITKALQDQAAGKGGKTPANNSAAPSDAPPAKPTGPPSTK